MRRISPLRYSQSFCNSSRNSLRWTIYQLWPPSSQNSQQKECKLHDKSVVFSTKRPKVLLLKQKISLLYLPLGKCPITRSLAIGKILEKLFGPGRPTHDHTIVFTKKFSCLFGPSQTRLAFLLRPHFCWHKRLKQLRNFKSLSAQLFLCIYFSQNAKLVFKLWSNLLCSKVHLMPSPLQEIYALDMYIFNRMKPEESTLLSTLRKKGKCKLNFKFHLCLHPVHLL